MSVHDTITRLGFKTGDYTVTRYAAGTVTTGRFTPGSTSTFSIAAVVQPQVGRLLKVGPEGQSGSDVRWLWTLTELRATAGTPDEVTVDGETWKVFEVQRWDGLGGTHFQCLIARQVVP